MKTLLKFLLAGAMMVALGAGCNDKGDPSEGKAEKPNEPVLPAGTIDEQLTAFFEKHGTMIGRGLWGIPAPLAGVYVPLIDTCVTIDSAEAFAQIGTGLELPAVDFDKYTLVIGQWVAHSGQDSLVRQDLVIEPQEAIMNLTVDLRQQSGLYYTQALSAINLWGLYPKLPRIPVHTHVTYTYRK